VEAFHIHHHVQESKEDCQDQTYHQELIVNAQAYAIDVDNSDAQIVFQYILLQVIVFAAISLAVIVFALILIASIVHAAIFAQVIVAAAISDAVIVVAAISFAVIVCAAKLLATTLQAVILFQLITVEFQTKVATQALLNKTRKSSFPKAGKVAEYAKTVGDANCQ
jgi:hypothetical protein